MDDDKVFKWIMITLCLVALCVFIPISGMLWVDMLTELQIIQTWECKEHEPMQD